MKSLKIDKILHEFVKKCQEKFGEDLVSIVLFGSVARGTAEKYSDIDLLVIAKNLPEDWREKDKLLHDEVMDFLMKYHKSLFPIITTPRAIETSQEKGNPLLYGVRTGYKLLLDRGNFFQNVMKNVEEDILQEKPVLYDKVKKWNLAKIVQKERSLQASS